MPRWLHPPEISLLPPFPHLSLHAHSAAPELLSWRGQGTAAGGLCVAAHVAKGRLFVASFDMRADRLLIPSLANDSTQQVESLGLCDTEHTGPCLLLYCSSRPVDRVQKAAIVLPRGLACSLYFPSPLRSHHPGPSLAAICLQGGKCYGTLFCSPAQSMRYGNQRRLQTLSQSTSSNSPKSRLREIVFCGTFATFSGSLGTQS